MARSIRSHHLETRSARLKLPVRGKAYHARVGAGLRLAYRRNKTDGTWSRLYRGKLRRIALADDYQDADGVRILSFDQAVSRCRLDVYGADEADINNADNPVTLAQAIDAYEADLFARGGAKKNATWLQSRTPGHLLNKAVSAISAKEFRAWRDDLVVEGKITPGTVNRLRAALLAALNNQRRLDPRVRDTWTAGWPVLPNARRARNVVIDHESIRRVVHEAYAIDPAFGLWCEVLAVTGCRPSQLARLNCGDMQVDRCLMPGSRKGNRARRGIVHKPVPLPPALAARLRTIAKDQAPDAPLLVQPDGNRWQPGAHYLPFKDATKAAGLDPAIVTAYSLRHSHITNALLRGVPIRLIADACDTSVAQIERNYSHLISNFGDAALRAGMLDLDAPASNAGNVVPLAARPR